MNADDVMIVKEVGAALIALNAALVKARDSGIDVDIDYASYQEFGKRGSLRVYRAEVSRQAFKVVAR